MSRFFRWREKTIWVYAPLTLGALIMAFPLLWMLSTSLKAPDEIFTTHFTLLPQTPM
jgi:ABC-type glycerol-3-phosphate transport system permease component